MSTMQRMTLIGLYNFEQQFERDLFRNLSLPEGYVKADFVNALLLEHGEKCVLYTNPDFLASAIGIWSNKWAMELTRIYEALSAEYNPIHNYDRFEEITDNHGKHYTSQNYAGHTASDNPKYDDDVTNDYDIVNKTDLDATTEHQVSADNSSTYQPDYKDTSNAGQTTTSNDGTIKRHVEGKTQDLTENSNSTTTDDETINDYHHGHLYGNIGVTTASAMVSEIVQQRFKYNLYDIAGKLFASELLIGIY